MICVIASITIRITGPSDIHDQTQPKTLSYTTDILTHSTDLDHWILPSIQQREPATKPPLYNWLAVPFVAVFGHQSIVAHKAPSLLTWLALIVILYRLGHHIDPAFRLTGPLAVIAFVTNYAWFKLGYLARPDGLLTLWLVIGWAAATALSDPSRTRPRFPALIMWAATGLAALTKGPPALLIPVYAVLQHFITNRDSSEHDKGGSMLRTPSFWIFLPIAILLPAAWLVLAYILNADHTYHIIIREEAVDRFLGIGAEGTKSGPWDWVRTAPNMPLFFLLRFLPWSVLFIGAAIDLLARPKGDPGTTPIRGRPQATNPDEAPARPWIIGAFTFTILVVVFFTFSAGKRADYIASAYVTGSLVVGWWLVHRGFLLARRAPWIIPCAALITLTGLAVNDSVWNFSAVHRFSDCAQDFTTVARRIIADDGVDEAPIVFYDCNRGPFQIVQVLMGCSQPDAAETDEESTITPFDPRPGPVTRHDSLWVITQPDSLAGLSARTECAGWSFIPIHLGEPASTSDSSGPKQLALYRADRTDQIP